MVGELSEDGKWIWDGTQWIPNSKFNPNQTPSTDSVNISFQDSVITEPIVTNIYNDVDTISQGILKAFDDLGVTGNILPSVSFLSAMEEKYNQIMNSDTELHPKVHLTLAKYKLGPAAMNLYLCAEEASMELLQAMKQLVIPAKDNIRMSLRSSIKQELLDWEHLSNITRSHYDLFNKEERRRTFYQSESNIISNIESINKLPQSVATLMSNLEVSDFYMSGTEDNGFGKNELTKFIEKSVLYSNKALAQAKELSLREELVSIYSDLMLRYSAMNSFTLAEASYEEGLSILGSFDLSTSVKLKFYICRGAMLLADTENATMVHRSNNQIIIDKLCQEQRINENKSKKIIDLNYDSIIDAAGIGGELPPPPNPALLNDWNTSIADNGEITQSMLDSIYLEPKREKDSISVVVHHSLSIPESLNDALTGFAQANPRAGSNDLDKFVSLSQFDQATQNKFWSLWRERVELFAEVLGGNQAADTYSQKSSEHIAPLISAAIVIICGLILLGYTGDAFTNFSEAKSDADSCIFFCSDEEQAVTDSLTALGVVCGMWLFFLIGASILPWGKVFD
jgi:hypothetical protein